jgi:hypothetical protein
LYELLKMNDMKTLRVLKYIGFGILGVAFVFLVIWGVMALWNWLIPGLFNGPVLTYWQTAGLFLPARRYCLQVSLRGGHDKSYKRTGARNTTAGMDHGVRMPKRRTQRLRRRAFYDPPNGGEIVPRSRNHRMRNPCQTGTCCDAQPGVATSLDFQTKYLLPFN